MNLSTDSVSDRLRRLARRLHDKKLTAEAEHAGVAANQHDRAINLLTVELENCQRDCARYRQELDALRQKSAHEHKTATAP